MPRYDRLLGLPRKGQAQTSLHGLTQPSDQSCSANPRKIFLAEFLFVGGAGGACGEGYGGGHGGGVRQGVVRLRPGVPYRIISPNGGAGGFSGTYGGSGNAAQLVDLLTGAVLIQAPGGSARPGLNNGGVNTSGDGAGGPAVGAQGGPGVISDLTGQRLEYGGGGCRSGGAAAPLQALAGVPPSGGGDNTPGLLWRGAGAGGAGGTGAWVGGSGLAVLRYPGPPRLVKTAVAQVSSGTPYPGTADGALTTTLGDNALHVFAPLDSSQSAGGNIWAPGYATFDFYFSA